MEVNTQQNKMWLMIKGRQDKMFNGEYGNCSELDGSAALSEPGSDPGRTTGSTDI